MKSLIIILTGQLILSLFFPWWIIVLVPLIYYGVDHNVKIPIAMFVSFISGIVLYLGASLFADLGADKSAASLLAALLGDIPAWSSYIIAGIIGGVVSAFGGLSGAQVSQIRK